MTENQPYQPGQPADAARPNPAPQDWREARREWREERRAQRHDGAWIWGLFLIALGLGFLLENMGLVNFRNWWAVFILIPAVGSFQTAWAMYRDAGRLNAAARGSLIGGMILATIAFIFLFGISSTLIWPVLLIAGGALLLLNALLPG